MNQPHDSTDDEDARGTSNTREKRILEGRSEASGNLAGPGPKSDQDEDPRHLSRSAVAGEHVSAVTSPAAVSRRP